LCSGARFIMFIYLFHQSEFMGAVALSGSEAEISFLILACRLLHKNKFVNGSQGNASIRLGHDRILIKPSGKSFRYLNSSDLVAVDMTAKVVKGFGEPSIETPVHLAIYKTRRDVNAVFHTHPLNVITFSLLKSTLELLRVERNVRIVPFVEYMQPGSKELTSAVSRQLRHYDAVILGKHGLVTVGKNVADAYNLIEVIDINAEIQNRTRQTNYN
jgi:L-fuculose-phosphate aldolase